MRRMCTSIGNSTSGARPLRKQVHHDGFDRRCVRPSLRLRKTGGGMLGKACAELPSMTRKRKCWTLFSATILAGALSGSVIAQTPDAGCALPSEPQGIPAALDAPIQRARADRIETLDAGPAMYRRI